MRSLGSWVKRALVSSAEKLMPRSFRDRLIRHYSIPDVDWSLRNARENGFSPEAIVDVGAYVGEWSRMAHRIFPEAEVLAVEPQRGKEKELKALSTECEKVSYEIALLGAESKQDVTFRLSGSNSKALSREREESDNEQRDLVQHDMTTLDALSRDTIFAQPDLLKLDVQTYELEVLRGASRILDYAPPELILMEVSLLDVGGANAPLFADVVDFMDDHKYRLYDLCSFIRRPYDDALWQVDALFAHSTSDLVASTRWK
jgi:FkbM family methyltransferase